MQLTTYVITATRGRRENIEPNFVYAITNARSINKKIDSVIDIFDNSNLSMFIIMETWLHKGPELDKPWMS